jgi:hypothetical protein
VNDIGADLHDWQSEEMKALGPEGRGRLIIMDQTPPGSITFAPDTMAARSTAYRTPLWYLAGPDSGDD